MRLINGLDMEDDNIPTGVRNAWEQAAETYPGEKCSREFVDDNGLKVRVTRLSDGDITEFDIEDTV